MLVLELHDEIFHPLNFFPKNVKGKVFSTEKIPFLKSKINFFFYRQISFSERLFILEELILPVLNLPVLVMRSISVASPNYQEGQSERTFPIAAFSSRFFLFFLDFFPIFPLFFPIFVIFFRCQGGTLSPYHYTGYAMDWDHLHS